MKFGIDDNEEGVGNRDDKFSAERLKMAAHYMKH